MNTQPFLHQTQRLTGILLVQVARFDVSVVRSSEGVGQ